MDLTIQSKTKKFTVNTVTTYEELLTAIINIFPFVTQVMISYVDEEGDEIQVTNTDDLIAISQPEKVTLKLVVVNGDEEQMLLAYEQKQKVIRIKFLEDQIQNKKMQLENENQIESKLKVELEHMKQALENSTFALQQEIASFDKQIEKITPLKDFQEELFQSDIFNKINELEKDLQKLDVFILFLWKGLKEFNEKLQSNTLEVKGLFSELYSERITLYAEKVAQQQVIKAEIKLMHSKLNETKNDFQKKIQQIEGKLVHHSERIRQFTQELEISIKEHKEHHK